MCKVKELRVKTERKVCSLGKQWQQEHNSQSRHTFIFHSDTKVWEEKPLMHEKRINHDCSIFEQDGKQMVMAVGGKTGSFITSKVHVVEMFDLEV